MKKAALIVLLLTGMFIGQNRPRPGIDYFPHIGFFDFIVNYKSPPNNLSTAAEIEDTTNSLRFYSGVNM